MTKVPYTTVWKIVNEGIKQRKKRSDAGNFRAIDEVRDADVIRRSIYELSNENIIPTVAILHKKLNEENRIKCSESTLRTFIQKIGFRYKTIDKRIVIMESERIRKWRYDYLIAIANFRNEGRPIYYLDETWYDTHDVAKKGWMDGSKRCVIDVPPSKGQRVIILNAGSENGWVHEDSLLLSAKNIKDAKVDYHDNMTSSMFQEWFNNKLIPHLRPNSVIVMDNASYHSQLIRKIPNSSSTKNEIMQFLYENDVFFEESYKERELLEVLRTKTYDKELPPYHCVFNPIELVWGELKGHVRRNNKCPKFSNQAVALIAKEVQQISGNSWKNCVDHVIKIEEQYRRNHVQPLIIDLGDDDSSEWGE